MRLLVLLASLIILLNIPIGVSQPPTGPPCNFAGYVNDGNAPVGVKITAEIDGKVYAESKTFYYEGDEQYKAGTVYSIDVPADNPLTDEKEGGVDGDIVKFRVDGTLCNEYGIWKQGESIPLDLTYNVSIIANAGEDITVKRGEKVYFNGTAVSQYSIVRYEWDFDGDGRYDWNSTENGIANFTYNKAGTYKAKLRVTDSEGRNATDVRIVKVMDDEKISVEDALFYVLLAIIVGIIIFAVIIVKR